MPTIPNSMNLSPPTLAWTAIGRHEAICIDGPYEVLHRFGAFIAYRYERPVGRFDSRLDAVSFCNSMAFRLAQLRGAA